MRINFHFASEVYDTILCSGVVFRCCSGSISIRYNFLLISLIDRGRGESSLSSLENGTKRYRCSADRTLLTPNVQNLVVTSGDRVRSYSMSTIFAIKIGTNGLNSNLSEAVFKHRFSLLPFERESYTEGWKRDATRTGNRVREVDGVR